MIYKSLTECKKCESYKGMRYESLVACAVKDSITVLSVSQPSHYIDSFENGEIIVYCEKEEIFA